MFLLSNLWQPSKPSPDIGPEVAADVLKSDSLLDLGREVQIAFSDVFTQQESKMPTNQLDAVSASGTATLPDENSEVALTHVDLPVPEIVLRPIFPSASAEDPTTAPQGIAPSGEMRPTSGGWALVETHNSTKSHFKTEAFLETNTPEGQLNSNSPSSAPGDTLIEEPFERRLSVSRAQTGTSVGADGQTSPQNLPLSPSTFDKRPNTKAIIDLREPTSSVVPRKADDATGDMVVHRQCLFASRPSKDLTVPMEGISGSRRLSVEEKSLESIGRKDSTAAPEPRQTAKTLGAVSSHDHWHLERSSHSNGLPVSNTSKLMVPEAVSIQTSPPMVHRLTSPSERPYAIFHSQTQSAAPVTETTIPKATVFDLSTVVRTTFDQRVSIDPSNDVIGWGNHAPDSDVVGDRQIPMLRNVTQNPLAVVGPASPQAVQNSINLQIVESVRSASKREIEVRLEPEELGKLRIVLSPRESGIHVLIMADRLDTLDLMRRNSDDLAGFLSEGGHSEATIDFGHFTEPDEEQSRSESELDLVSPQNAVIHPMTAEANGLGLNIRI